MVHLGLCEGNCRLSWWEPKSVCLIKIGFQNNPCSTRKFRKLRIDAPGSGCNWLRLLLLTEDDYVRVVASFSSRLGYSRDTSVLRRAIDAAYLLSCLLHITEIGQELDLVLMRGQYGSLTEDSQSSPSANFPAFEAAVSAWAVGKSSSNWDLGLLTTFSPNSKAFRLHCDVPAASIGIGVLDRTGTIDGRAWSSVGTSVLDVAMLGSPEAGCSRDWGLSASISRILASA